ncbi:ATP-binding cassette domain-containing protein [Nocardia bovistercoris]|uniref:ABC transporter ATP-binding protein n=1 Tax=Nocardia bovistercoris TaxID=2785916 RepID=A0A931N5B6_9NOCA|nr:ABC transporter ATP-binding protein [Nocardia bovistercoris]MBH0779572.1 ABC transporter ATP-binding protein [Nocardia bovistercoris]
MSLLTCTDLDIWYKRRGVPPTRAVAGLSLTVEAGELVTVVGESGSGKSSVIRAAIGLLPLTSRVGGRIRLDGVDVAGWSHNRFARYRGSYIGYIPQDPAVSLNPVKPIGRQLEDALRGRLRRHRLLPFGAGAHKARIRLSALRFLELAGLPAPETIYAKYPHELSGGMRQRVLIAIALSGEPKLLLADEPTSALDVTVQKQILDHLDLLRAELGIGILLVTHDLGVALDRADRIVVMREGRVVETGTPAEIRRPRESYTRRLLDAAPGLHTARLTPRPLEPGAHTGSGGHSLSARPRGAAAHEAPTASADRPDHRYAIEVREVSKSFRTRRGGIEHTVRAADRVSFAVPAGTTHALVGESGAGKSTIARIVAGLTTADSGEVRLLGQTEPWTRTRLSRSLQFVYQNPYSSLNPRFSVANLITEPIRVHRRDIGRSARAGIAAELLDAVRLPRAHASRRAGELSGGQAQRVAIARALSLNPEIVVLDEAVSALDVSVQHDILRLLTDLQAAYALTYLFITHDLGVVRLFCDTVSVLRAGTVVESGATAAVFDAPRAEYTARLIASVPGIEEFSK